jgi:hypothetical protein
MMNISVQPKALAQSNQLQNNGVFVFNRPSNRIVSNMIGQFGQHFKQSPNDAKFFISDIKRITTLVRLLTHDAGLLAVSKVDYSLDVAMTGCIEQNELHFWKRDQEVISNV